MKLNELNKEWQEIKVPLELNQELLDNLNKMETAIKKENTNLSFWFAGTIYLTGFFVFPLLNDTRSMFLLMGLWLLMGTQAIIFWLRQSKVNKTEVDIPEKYINAKLSKLKYSIMVTNIFMPLYMIFLSILSSLYISSVLSGLDSLIVTSIIIFNCCFYIFIFSVFWKKQQAKNMKSVVPQIAELNILKRDYRKF